MKVKIKQFRNKAKEPVAGLTPEHAIYDNKGERLDNKLNKLQDAISETATDIVDNKFLISLSSKIGVKDYIPFSSIPYFKSGYFLTDGHHIDSNYVYIKIPYINGSLSFYGPATRQYVPVVAVDINERYSYIRNWALLNKNITENEIPANTIAIIVSLQANTDFSLSGFLLNNKKNITFSYTEPQININWEYITPANTEYRELTIQNGSWGTFNETNAIINLENDIIIDNNLSSSTFNNSNVIINGNGHNIYLGNKKYNPVGFYNGFKYCELEDSFSLSISTWFVAKGTNSVKALSLSTSDLYKMKSFTYNESTNEVEVILPDELKSISISEDENVYISFSVWYYKVYGKVTYCSNGTLRFINIGKRSVNNEAMTYTSNGVYFRLINYKYYGNGLLVKNNKVYFPSCYNVIYKQYNDNSDVITNNINSYLEINNATIYGTLHNVGGKLKVNSCKFPTPHTICISNENNGKLEVNNCEFNYNNGYSIYSSGDARIKKNIFIGHGIYCTNHNGSWSNNIASTIFSKIEGNVIIEKNTFIDCASSIHTGNTESISKDLNFCGDTIIRNNTITFSKQYYIEGYNYKLSADSGLIYVGTINKNTIIINNILIGGSTNKSCHSIFMDDGAFNVTIANNIISNIRNTSGCSIDSRYESRFDSLSYLPAESKPCTNNKIYHNYVDYPIRLNGNPKVTDNKCKFAENVVLGSSNIDNEIINNTYIGKALFEIYKGFIDDTGGINILCD